MILHDRKLFTPTQLSRPKQNNPRHPLENQDEPFMRNTWGAHEKGKKEEDKIERGI